MASTSSSSVQKSFKYDVFLSFRGEDTRNTFVGHLYHALQQKCIETYKDDEKIKKGKTISDELIQAIEDSKFYIIVFSKNYASSSWCLDELVKIMECQKMSEHTAFPVFLDVEPSEVRKQSGVVEVAFAKHENDKSAVNWREALKEAADLAGWELKNTFYGHEAKLVQKIVEEISLELRFIDSDVNENFIGMKARINDVVSTLALGVDDVRMIGIKGMGGAGKTTLARAVYDHISFQFEGCSFVENVREESTPSMSGLKLLQKQVLSDILSDQGISVSGVLEGKSMLKKKMCGKKVLIVLDDVDKIEQLVALAGERNWFRPGSRIIITTRDQQVLLAFKVNSIHDVSLLSNEEAICLFSRYAFGREIPIPGYAELSRQVVRYAAGLPLSIRVLGSFLCGQDELEWKDALERLKTIPLKETLEKLELSYNSLEEDYKEIFLDVACFLKGWKKHLAIRALESCGFRARIGLRVLEQRSLITVSEYGELGMHDHIEEMGKNIVRRLHLDEPNKHSRLWIDEEIKDILTNDKGTQSIKGIQLATGRFDDEIIMKGIANMKQIRFLVVYTHDNYHGSARIFNGSNWKFNEASLYLSNAIRFLKWKGYPFWSFPKTFLANNLVGLDLSVSNMVQLWEDGEGKVLPKLRFLVIDNSVLRILDLRFAPNLEMLSLSDCNDLVELHMPNESLKLISLILSQIKLRTLDLRFAPNLEMLNVTRCNDLAQIQMPTESRKLVTLDLCYLELMTLHLGVTPNLEWLSIHKCHDLIELHMPTECLNLRSLSLSHLKLRTLDLGLTPNLERLSLDECPDLVELHTSAECIYLRFLSLSYLKVTTLDLRLAPNLENLSITGCKDLEELHMPNESLELRSLDLSHLKLRTLNLGLAPNLEKLFMTECGGFTHLQMPSESLKLICIVISHSKLRTLHLGINPNLETLSLEECNDLLELHMPAECPNLRSLSLSPLKFRTLDLEQAPYLKMLYLLLSELQLIVKPTDACAFQSDNNSPKFEFSCYYKEDQASSFGNLERFISVGHCVCTNLESFFEIICSLQRLRKLTLEGSIPEAPKDLNQLEYLEELIISSTDIQNMPDSICMLKHLKVLVFKCSWYLQKLPDDLGQLECLETLILRDCVFLGCIPNSICDMKRLKHLDLCCCILVEKLPEELGRLNCLEELDITRTRIIHLPQSIFQLKGLCIVADINLFESCGLTPKIRRTSANSSYGNADHVKEMVCYI